MDMIADAKIRLVARSPFWATLVLNTPMVVTETPLAGLPPGREWTAGTDGRTLWLNPEFVRTLPPKQVVFLLAHEAAHIMFEHPWRVGPRDIEVWRAAADYVVNHLLVEEGFEMIPGGLLDPRYTTSTEQVYEQLLQDGSPPPQGGIGQDILPAPLSDAEQAECVQQVRRLVAQAATAARLAGKLSGTLERLVGEVLEPTVPWPDVLRDYMLDVAQDAETWARRSRRFADAYLPSHHSVKLGAVCVIVDTSGSISDKALGMALTEIREIAERLHPSSIHIISADTEVASDVELMPDDAIPTTFPGGGGTDMRVPLKHVEQYEPCVTILFTDGETPWPACEPPYPLIVCCSTTIVPPVGQLVRVLE